MSAVKKLDRKDVFTTVHLATKSNSTLGSNASDYGISFLSGVSGSLSFPGFSSAASLKYPAFSYEQLLQYRSIRQLYYGNISQDLLTGSFEEYRQYNKISGYLCDVLDHEPISKNEKLVGLNNVIITPHVGSRTYENVVNQGIAAIKNTIEFF